MRSLTAVPIAALAVGLAAASAPAPARADTRFLAYDAANDLTQAMTKGLTFEVRRGLFGAVRIQRLFSTSSRGSAELEEGGPDGVRRQLPDGADEDQVYRILPTGDGRGLARALCPSADSVWLVTGRVRAARPLTVHAVGQWSDGTFRHCLTLNYEWRGEWATEPLMGPPAP